jgi:hypothetical protein
MPDESRPCAVCGRPIDAERAAALPETRLCIDHARAITKYGGEFLLIRRQVSLGKAGSLKKNYGDVSFVKHRNIVALAKLREEYERLRQGEAGAGD